MVVWYGAVHLGMRICGAGDLPPRSWLGSDRDGSDGAGCMAGRGTRRAAVRGGRGTVNAGDVQSMRWCVSLTVFTVCLVGCAGSHGGHSDRICMWCVCAGDVLG